MSTAPPQKPPVRSATTQLPAVPGARSLASVTPFGWHLPGVHPWRSLWSTMVDNLDNLPAAWSVLAHGVCDRSSLGVAGLNDGLPGGFHIDEPRRRHLRHHTQPAIAPADLLDLPRLRRMKPDALANLGRLGALCGGLIPLPFQNFNNAQQCNSTHQSRQRQKTIRNKRPNHGYIIYDQQFHAHGFAKKQNKSHEI